MANSNGGLKRVLIKVGLGTIVFLFVFGLVGGTVMFIASTGKFPPRPDRRLDALMSEQEIQAPTVVLVMRYQNVIYKKAWPEGTDPDHEYSLGHLVEPWIAEAIMMLSDRGKLDLDHALANYLPGEDGLDPTLSVASYLDHTATLKTAGGEHSELRSEENYRLLWHLIGVVTGAPPQAFLHHWVHEALEMKATRYLKDPVSGDDGQWVSTISDLTTWTKTLNSNKLVHLKTYLRGHTPVTLKNGEKAPYGFGWQLVPWNGMRLEQAIAMGDGGNFSITRLPARNFAVLVCSEMPVDALDTAQLGKDIAQIYLEREFAAPFRRKLEKPSD